MTACDFSEILKLFLYTMNGYYIIKCRERKKIVNVINKYKFLSSRLI